MRSPVRIALILSLILSMSVFGQQPPAPRSTVPATARSVSSAAAVSNSANATATERRLPVRRVVLYKNGIGYFEHVGRVNGAQDVTIDFTSAQLNDVLKSLTALDLGGGRVTGVAYNSDAPLARRLGALRLPLGERTSLQQFLDALRGAKLEIRNGAAVFTGRLLSVERKTRVSGGTTLEVDYLSLITDSGEVRTLELTPQINLRLAERDLGGEVSRYLDLISSTRAQDLRRMTIATTGTGERPLFVSYISEVPVWKTTYRLVLPSKPGAKPLLQGWAIVDNTVGEDWNNVELSLVAGAPQSFIQQLSQPYYSRRPVVALPEAAQLTPQTHQASLIGGYGNLSGTVTDPSGAVVPGAVVRVVDDRGNQIAQTSANHEGHYSFAALPAGNYNLEIEQAGFNKMVYSNLTLNGAASVNLRNRLEIGAVSHTVTVEAEPVAAETSMAVISGGRSLGTGRALGTGNSTREYRLSGGGIGGGVGSGIGTAAASPAPNFGVAVGNARAALTAAQARELGDLFEYKPKEPITILKNQSAMVPIVNTEIAMEKVSLWNANSGNPRPWRALWLTNSSALTLDGGTFNVLEDETFAGEGLIEPLKAGEKRILSYALDLGVQVSTARDSERQAVRRVIVLKGTMISYSSEREKKMYIIRNDDASPRTVIIEHAMRPEWKLQPTSAVPAESSAGHYRFRVTVEPKKTAQLVVLEGRPTEARYQISDLHDERVALFLRDKSINAEIEKAFREIIAKKQEVATPAFSPASMSNSKRSKKSAVKSSTTSNGCVKTSRR